MPLRRFRYDARHDVLKCPQGRILRPQRPVKHGRFFYSRVLLARERLQMLSDAGRSSLTGARHQSRGDRRRLPGTPACPQAHGALVRGGRPALPASPLALGGLPRRGEDLARAGWHGLARAVRRGLQTMRIQAFLTAAAINLKRLAAALANVLANVLAVLVALLPALLVQLAAELTRQPQIRRVRTAQA